jgi:hypothetical protein
MKDLTGPTTKGAAELLSGMKTLAEIEQAAQRLPTAKQTELLYYLAQCLD